MSKNTVKDFLYNIEGGKFNVDELLKMDDPKLEATLFSGNPSYKDKRYENLIFSFIKYLFLFFVKTIISIIFVYNTVVFNLNSCFMKLKDLLPRILVTLVLTIFYFASLAQNDTVKYSEVINDPTNISDYRFMIAPLSLETAKENLFTLGFGLGAKATIADRFKVNFMYNRPYTESIYDFANQTGSESINGESEHPIVSSIKTKQDFDIKQSFEVGFAIVIGDKIADKDILINLASKKTGNIIVNTVTDVEAKVRKRNSIRAGYKTYGGVTSLVKGTAYEEDYALTERGDKLHYDGIDYVDVDYESIDYIDYSRFGEREVGWATNYNSNVGFIGYEVEFIKHLIIETDNYGEKEIRVTKIFYADFMYGQSNLSDVNFFASNPGANNEGEEVNTEIVRYKPKIDGEVVKENKMGFRVGMEFLNNSKSRFQKWEDRDKTSSVPKRGAKIEAGFKPGINTGYYLLGGITIGLNL